MSYSLGRDVTSSTTSTSGTVTGIPVEVQTIQAWLRAIGYTVRIDGVWGSQTATALTQYATRKSIATPIFAITNSNRTLVFQRSDDPLLKSLRNEGTAAIAAALRVPDSPAVPTTAEPLPSPSEPSEPSIFISDSIISGVPNWVIFGGAAAVAGYFAWRSKKAA